MEEVIEPKSAWVVECLGSTENMQLLNFDNSLWIAGRGILKALPKFAWLGLRRKLEWANEF